VTWWNCRDKTCTFALQIINVRCCNQLLTDMEARKETFELDADRSDYSDSVHFELGGFGNYIGGQPRLTIDIFDSQLVLDCASVPEWLRKLKEYPHRKFADGTEYIKIHSKMRCLILTLPERETLLFQLAGKEKEAEEKTKKFYDGLQSAYDLMHAGAFEAMFPTIDIKDISNLPKLGTKELSDLFPKKGDDEPKE